MCAYMCGCMYVCVCKQLQPLNLQFDSSPFLSELFMPPLNTHTHTPNCIYRHYIDLKPKIPPTYKRKFALGQADMLCCRHAFNAVIQLATRKKSGSQSTV